jgi:hypothetical protein
MEEIQGLIEPGSNEGECECFKQVDEYFSLTWEQRVYGFAVSVLNSLYWYSTLLHIVTASEH